MSSVIIKLDAFTRPITADADAAYFTVLRDKTTRNVRVLFRCKRAGEANALVSMRNAEREIPGAEWKPVGFHLESHNQGGVPNEDSEFYKFVDLEPKNGSWGLLGELDAYASASSRTAGEPVRLPPANAQSESTVRSVIAQLVGAAGPVIGRVVGGVVGSRVGLTLPGAAVGEAVGSRLTK